MKPIDEQVRSIISEYSGVKEELVNSGSSLDGDLAMDSLDTISITMALEEKFGIEIPDEDAEKLTTVGEVTEYIQKAIGAKSE